jgi:hypothetical protein
MVQDMKNPQKVIGSGREKMTADQGLDDFVASAYLDVQARYNRYSTECDLIKRYGYWVLCGPPRLSPPIFIVSLNPGASQASMASLNAEDRAPTTWPTRLNYLRRISPFAQKLSGLFDLIPEVDLGDCCAGYTLFFRSPKIANWRREVPKTIRSDLKAFSLEKTRQLIEVMNPGLVITFGSEPFRKIATETGAPIVEKWGTKSITLARYGECAGIPSIGFPHISGARLSNDHLGRIASLIRASINGVYATVPPAHQSDHNRLILS